MTNIKRVDSLKDNYYIGTKAIRHNKEKLSDVIDNMAVEIGSNTYGSYIKFANGIMICYGSSGITMTFEKTQDAFYRAIVSSPFTFPYSFQSTPSVQVMVSTSNSSDYLASVVKCQVSTSKIVEVQLIHPLGSSGHTTLSYIAIGKWK